MTNRSEPLDAGDSGAVSVLDWLRAAFPDAKTTTLREMVSEKRVLLNGKPVRSLKEPVEEDDKVEVADHSAARSMERTETLAHKLKLIHVDAQVVLVNKPHGLISATDSKERRPTALKVLTTYFQNMSSNNEIYLIHRLDKDASGLLLFARTSAAFRSLKQQFFEHTITRRYDVLVHGVPKKKQGRIESLLVEDEKTGIVYVTTNKKEGKEAALDYLVIRSDAKRDISHVQCTLHTGRKHQIRAQMKAIGHPVLADPLYSLPGKTPTPDEPPGRLALHASHLSFEHPGTGKKASFDSPMPGLFDHLFH